MPRPGGLTAIFHLVLSGVATMALISPSLLAESPTTGPARLLKDINRMASPEMASFPGGFVGVGGITFFEAFAPETCYELWRTDGTEAGTVLVKDINPGRSCSSPETLTEIGGTLFFPADDGTHGVELWAGEGTEAGTRLVKDIRPGGLTSAPVLITEVNGALIFQVDDGTTVSGCGGPMGRRRAPPS